MTNRSLEGIVIPHADGHVRIRGRTDDGWIARWCDAYGKDLVPESLVTLPADHPRLVRIAGMVRV